jgi:SAM-dependent methyltransferase
MKYFERRECGGQYGSSYWDNPTDPDGLVRDLSAERSQKLNDMADELAWLNELPPGKFLDIGSGLGFALDYMAARGWSCFGVEPDVYARQRYRDSHGRSPSMGTLDSELVREAFDAALCYHVAEHMLDPVVEMAHVYAALRPGARLVVGTPDFGSPVAREYGERFRLLHDRTHVRLFTSWGLWSMLRDLGFEIVDVRWPYFGTRHHTEANLRRLMNTAEGICPAAPGNIVSVYCVRGGA